jgi:isoleucyl-tRNA synthetase
MFEKIEKFNLPDIEEKVLDFWKTNHVFEKVKSDRKGNKKFVFYEGPPTANGKPGIHHVLARAFKDVIPRYKTMQGFDVPRKAGWDTHGLPVELEVEKKLGFNSKEDIEDYGVGKFNQKCKESVWKYKDEWENLTERIGFWLDMEKPYITYENSYMETLWWIVKQVANKGYLFKGHKIVPWCPRCGTGLSSHELAQGYKDVTEDSVFMKFKLSEGQKIKDFNINKKTYILSWTTTPWTLPGNVALAVGKNIDYVILEVNDEKWILAETRLEVLDNDYKILSKIKGVDLLELSYIPLFDVEDLKKDEKVYKIYSADFVTTEDGTGVVHTAVMYGEDDYVFGKEIGLPEYHTVDEQGRFKKSVVGFEGMKVKDDETNKKIFNELEKKGFLLKKQEYTHEYPHCWRCDTPVLYYGRESWFFNMSSLRKELVKENNNINWVPSHIKEGRFGEWIKGAKDWAISRERYWGTPLPIWECDSCGNREILGSMSEIDERLGSSTNNYILMRHGEAEHNAGRFLDGNPEELEKVSLTDDGKKEIIKKIKNLKSKKIDLIICSDFKRTKQTAEIISKELGVEVLTDERIREFNSGNLNGKPDKELGNIYGKPSDKFIKKPEGGESLRDVSKRVSEFLLEIDKKYKDKNILIVSHEWPLWMMEAIMKGWSEENSVWQRQDLLRSGKNGFFETSEIRDVKLLNLPRNIYGFADLHRPYVDEIKFKCDKCGKEMKRVPEVMDVWFDSGSMPFAQAHFPFEQQGGLFKKVPNPNKKIDYPADYICEAMDQTRGWFYTLLSTAALLGYKKPYKNVISLGLILDENGQKMSKSKGNVVNPWDAIDDYGADIIRWYFYTVNKPGEPKRFDGNEVKKTLRSFIFTIYNSFSFLNLYIENKIDYKEKIKTENVLDKWILSRLNNLVLSSEKLLEEYNIGGACREIEFLVEDLSKWYIRRSRRRFQKPDDENDFNDVVFVLGYSLLQLSKIIAPFTPFFAEGLYQSLKKRIKNYDFKLSVHLESWPKFDKGLNNKELEEKMETVRIIASEVLAIREKEKIKVRQPLQSLKINNKELEGEDELLEILKDEINIKEIIIDGSLKEIKLNTEITHELKEEGLMRDLVRKIQKGRQDAGLDPKDEINLGITGDDNIKRLVDKNNKKLQKEVRANNILSKLLDKYDLKFETKISGHNLEITIYKV